MISRILDTSVAAAWYLPEIFSTQARDWRGKLVARQARLIVPSLHFVELANVLHTYVRRQELPPELAGEIYETHLLAGLEVLDPPPEEILATALKFGATAYDAVYILLSRRLQIPLLTAERTTTPWVIKLGGLADAISIPRE